MKVLRKQKQGSGRVAGGFSGDGMLTEFEFVAGAEESLPAIRNQRYDSKSHCCPVGMFVLPQRCLCHWCMILPH